MRKSLLDFSWSRLKKRLFNKFYLGSFFSVSHRYIVLNISIDRTRCRYLQRFTSEGSERGFIYFLYVYYISSLKHFISQERSPLHYESFSYPLHTETAFQIKNKKYIFKATNLEDKGLCTVVTLLQDFLL